MKTLRRPYRPLHTGWIVGLIVSGLTAPGFPQLVPRTPWPKEPLVLGPAAPPGAEFELVIKFNDEARVRVTPGGLVSETGADLNDVIAVADSFGVSFARGFNLPEGLIEAYEENARIASGREVADLLGIIDVVFPEDTSQAELVDIGNALQDEDPVEYVELGLLLELPSGDIVPNVTPSHVGLQEYRLSGTATGGMDFEYAWSTGAGKGAGIHVTDVEPSLLLDHEDLCGLPVIAPTVQAMFTAGTHMMAHSDQDHGTAVTGILFARDNAYGMSGVVPDADMYFSPVRIETAAGMSVPRRKDAIVEAVAPPVSLPGDVVLIELQEGLVADDNKPAPADVRKYIYDAIEPGLLADVIVVLPAGNGQADLDSAPYSTYLTKLATSGTGGALTVGAGTAGPPHARLTSSTYGSRIDVQAWGEDVATLANAGGTPFDHSPPMPMPDKRQRYCDGFGKTSAAAALVAGACASIQSYAVDRLCRRLTLAEMRTLLKANGIPQGGPMAATHPIGPFVDVRMAMKGLRSSIPSMCLFLRGDCNGDGAVNLTDALCILQYLFDSGPTPPCLEACDVNDDGMLNIVDGVLLLNFIFGPAPAPPSPGPAVCGPDPLKSVDNLGCAMPPTCPP